MKKIVSLFLLVAAFTSCGEEIKFSNPGFQATKNGNIWKANQMDAVEVGPGLIVTASVGSELVILNFASSNVGTYALSSSSASTATFQNVDDGSPVYEAISGELNLTDTPAAGTVSGTFKFVAEDEDGNRVNFTNGVFYKVP